MVKLECNIEAQNCASLYAHNSQLIKLPYGAGSCVRDTRLAGNVGRCGFPGAQCVVNSDGNDNCAYGGDNTKPNYTPLCQNGRCGGGLGAICRNGNYDCNWGYYCNSTAGQVGVCGGQGSFVSDQGDGGDFAVDYCLSGKASLSSNGYWYCVGGVFLGAIPSMTTTPRASTSSILSASSQSSSSITSHAPVTPTGTPQSDSLQGSSSTLSDTSTTETSSGTSTNTAPLPSGTDLASNTNGSSNDNSAGTSVQSNKTDKTPIIAGVCAALGIVLLALLAFLAWRKYRKNHKIRLASDQGFSYPVPQHPTGISAVSEQPPTSLASGERSASFPSRSFGYLPEIQSEGEVTGTNVGSTYPSGYHPVAPSSPYATYDMASGSNPSLVPPAAYHDPFVNPAVESPAYSGSSGPSQYSAGGNMDATERHLLAVREEAERQLRAYDQRSR